MKSKPPLSDPENPCSLAIIDGTLCRVNRKGRAVLRYRSMAGAVEQFELIGKDRVIVREEPVGFLPGFTNLCCLDPEFRLIWFADLPADDDLYVTFTMGEAGAIEGKTISGTVCSLSLETGRIERKNAMPRPEAA